MGRIYYSESRYTHRKNKSKLLELVTKMIQSTAKLIFLALPLVIARPFHRSAAYQKVLNSEISPMEKAIKLSITDTHLGGPFGAVIVNSTTGEILGSGRNLVTSTNDPTAHAEVTAIRDATSRLGDFKLEGTTMYSSCEPCPMCLASIYWARIDKIVYANDRKDAAAIGFDDEFLYQEMKKENDERSLPILQSSPEEHQIARDAFQAWYSNKKNIRY